MTGEELNLLQTQRRVFESGIDASAKLVALALLNHWSRATETFPSVARLAAWTTLDRTTVMRCLAKLEQLGAITVTRRNGASNRYHLGQLSLLPVAPRDRSDIATGRTVPPRPVAPCDPTSRTMRPEEIQEEIQEVIHLGAHEVSAPAKPVRKAKRRAQPETSIPSDWQPTEQHKAYAAKHGLNLDLEVDSFRGWADGRLAVSWNGTFSTRLANAAKWKRERAQGSYGRGKPQVQRGGSVRNNVPDWDRAAE